MGQNDESKTDSKGRWGTKLWERWQEENLNTESRGGTRSQHSRARAWQITELISWYCGQGTTLSCPTLLGKELTSQSCSQLLPGKNSNISDHLGQSGSEQPQTSIVTCIMGRRDQWLVTNQASGETTAEILPAPVGPSDQGNTGLINTQANSPQAVLQREAATITTQPSKWNLRRDRDTEKALVISASTWIWCQSPELFPKWFFFTLFYFLFLFFPFLFSIFNFITTIFLILFLLPSLCLLFLCYNPLFSTPTIFQPLSIHSFLLPSPSSPTTTFHPTVPPPPHLPFAD
jgi:hypothetical protein